MLQARLENKPILKNPSLELVVHDALDEIRDEMTRAGETTRDSPLETRSEIASKRGLPTRHDGL
jgi:hypothetical protein